MRGWKEMGRWQPILVIQNVPCLKERKTCPVKSFENLQNSFYLQDGHKVFLLFSRNRRLWYTLQSTLQSPKSFSHMLPRLILKTRNYPNSKHGNKKTCVDVSLLTQHLVSSLPLLCQAKWLPITLLRELYLSMDHLLQKQKLTCGTHSGCRNDSQMFFCEEHKSLLI